MACLICCDVKNNIIVCYNCKYDVCEDCLSKYFKVIAEPKCPSCNLIWTHEFISTFSKEMYTCCLATIEKTLLEKELILLPYTQEFAIREKEALSVLKHIEKINVRISEKKEKFYSIQKQVLKLEIKPSDSHYLLTKQSKLFKQAFQSKESFYLADALDIVQKLRDVSSRVIRNYNIIFCNCPAKNCRGYINYSTMDCGFCLTKVCKICTSVLIADEIHKCKEEEIATAETIRNETKLCPKCSVPIFKIEGCDQMWCTQCHFAFSWNTGEEDGDVVVHNPHFYEWQRQQNNGVIPRVRGDNNYIETIKYYEKLNYYKEGTSEKEKLRFFYRISQYTKPVNPLPVEVNNIDLRIKYILNIITKDELSKKVFSRGIIHMEKLDVYHIFETFFKSADEILTSHSNFIEKIDKLVTFINQQFIVISKKYFSYPREIIYDDNTGYKIFIKYPNFYFEDRD